MQNQLGKMFFPVIEMRDVMVVLDLLDEGDPVRQAEITLCILVRMRKTLFSCQPLIVR